MNADILARGLPGLLGPVWRLSPPYEIEPIAGGMNSVVVGVTVLGLLMIVMRRLLRQATALRTDMEAVI